MKLPVKRIQIDYIHLGQYYVLITVYPVYQDKDTKLEEYGRCWMTILN